MKRRTTQLLGLFALSLSTAMLTACGGGGGGAGTTPMPPPPASISNAQRAAAAKATAEQNAQCVKIAPYYWEIGDKTQSLANGSVSSGYTATSSLSIASASKFMYAAYVGQKRNGTYTADDMKSLTFTSGYTSFSKCAQTDSVHSCAISGTNGDITAANISKFFYGGGHMQAHADQFMGLGAYTNTSLASELNTTLGLNASAADFTFTQPQPAGGIKTTPQVYTSFLHKMLDGSLKLGGALSANGVCTSATACPTQAVSSPFPPNETPLYALGHWIEDKTNSDGAFSSPGLFGFYPWIDASSTYYGVVARETAVGITSIDPQVQPYTQSMFCGRLIRKAWLTGQSIP